MAHVEIYTKVGCPFCARAKDLLASKNVTFDEYDAGGGGPKKDEMVARAPGARTFPQVFIDGKLIGGSDDLAALDKKGGLDPLLAA